MQTDFEVHILTKNQYLPLSYRARLSSMESYNYFMTNIIVSTQFVVRREVISFFKMKISFTCYISFDVLLPAFSLHSNAIDLHFNFLISTVSLYYILKTVIAQ